MSSRLGIAGIVLLAAFGLAACGGGGGSGTASMPTEPPEEMEPMEPVDPGPTAEEIAAATKEAESKLKAINAIDAADGLGGGAATTAGTGAGSYNLSVKRDRTATTVTVSVQEGATADADEDEKFELAEDLGDGLTMHTRDGEMGMQEIALVMTDIAEPKATPFGKVHMLNVDADGDTATGDDAVAFDPGGQLASTDDAQAVILGRMMSSAFAAPGDRSASVTRTFLPAVEDADPDTPGNQPRAAAMVAGTYDGAMGTYTCSGSVNCTVAVNDKGKLTAASDGWIFTPAEGATVDVANDKFLSYGFWLKKTTKDGATTYNEIAPFTQVDGLTASSGTITGSASYEGSAVGVYVHNVLSEGGGKVESRTAGHFTADANLMAYFAQPGAPDNNIPPNKLNTVTGMIDNFMLSGEENQDWSVALKGTIDGSDFSITGTANGGGKEGSLAGQFYGDTDMAPSAVTGEFDATFSNGRVAGSFGARKPAE